MAYVTLSGNDDIYTAANADDIILALDGNDTITASAGGNVIYGGDGNDTLNGADGNDTLFGDNTPNVNYHNVLNGKGGNDAIYSYSAFDQINAGSGNDDVVIYATTVTSGGSSQIVEGGSGNDRLELFALADISNSVHIVMGSTFSPSISDNTGSTFTNFETLYFYGGNGALTISGADGNDFLEANHDASVSFDAGYLKGMGGNDTLSFNGNPSTGIENIIGGSGTDTLLWTQGNSSWTSQTLTIDASSGEMRQNGTKFAIFSAMENLTVNASFQKMSSVDIIGMDGVNTLTINATSIEIVTNAANDVITIINGAANVTAGGGNDAVSINFADSYSSTIHGNDGDDMLHGGTGQDLIYGDAGDDNLSTSNGLTSEYGGSGNDTLYLTSSYANNGTGHATLDGGSGTDKLTLELSLSTKTFKADFSKASLTLADGTHIENCEAVVFSSAGGSDILTASNSTLGNAFNKLLGNGGNDTLKASSHGAWLDGGAGDDTLIAGAGVDNLVGGYNETNVTGDTVSYANSKTGVTVDLGLATAQLSKGDASGDVISKIENLIGSGFNDVLKGNDFNSLLFASGKNVLDGGAGNDKLTGGNQSDTFAFSTGDDKDTVTDFSATGGDHDVIDLSGLKSITDFSDLTAHHLSQAANGDAIINGLGGDTLTLKHVDIGNLDSGDFHF